MKTKIGLLKAIFDKLEVDFSINSFSNRLVLQKVIYLTQVTGLDLGYRYSWYIHGPYSPDLTETAYHFNDNKSYYNEHADKFSLTKSGINKLDIVKSLMQPKAKLALSDWLELLASIHYLKHIAYQSSENRVTKKNIVKMLKEYGKPQFTEKEVLTAWATLSSHGGIRNRIFQEN